MKIDLKAINWRAIIAGVVFTGVLWLIGQLVYVLVASAIGIASAHHEWTFFSTYKEQLWFVTAMLVYCTSMVVGGVVTSFLCNHHFVLNASIAGGVTGCLVVLSSLGVGQLTVMGILLVVFGFAFAAVGGYLWQRFFVR